MAREGTEGPLVKAVERHSWPLLLRAYPTGSLGPAVPTSYKSAPLGKYNLINNRKHFSP